jgi:hypothetical protein
MDLPRAARATAGPPATTARPGRRIVTVIIMPLI